MAYFLNVTVSKITLYNVCSVHGGMFSTSEDTMSTSEDTMSTSGDILSTSEGYHDSCGDSSPNFAILSPIDIIFCSMLCNCLI